MTAHSAVEGKGRAKPTRVLISCELFCPTCTQKVTVRDISRTSAHITGARGIPGECDAILRRGSLFLAVRVTGIKGDEATLKFYRQLSPEEIARALPGAQFPG